MARRARAFSAISAIQATRETAERAGPRNPIHESPAPRGTRRVCRDDRDAP